MQRGKSPARPEGSRRDEVKEDVQCALDTFNAKYPGSHLELAPRTAADSDTGWDMFAFFFTSVYSTAELQGELDRVLKRPVQLSLSKEQFSGDPRYRFLINVQRITPRKPTSSSWSIGPFPWAILVLLILAWYLFGVGPKLVGLQ